MIKPGPAFTRPRIPAAKCLQLVRLNPIITRSELVESTGLSQPTITRATTALLNIGLIQERHDLTRSQGRGRPTVPLESAEAPWILAGIAVGTEATYIALYDTMGRLLRDDVVNTHVASLSQADFIEYIIAGVNKLLVDQRHRLVSVGVTTSGQLDDRDRVTAPNLGWQGFDIRSRLEFQFQVPVTVSAAVPAILGSETQGTPTNVDETVLVLFADDSLGAALSDSEGVKQIRPLPQVRSSLLGNGRAEEVLTTAHIEKVIKDSSADERSILNERAHQLGTLTAQLIDKYAPNTVVIAGSAFADDSEAPRRFASVVRKHAQSVQLRIIPTHREIVRAVSRAVALDPLLRDPIELGKVAQALEDRLAVSK